MFQELQATLYISFHLHQTSLWKIICEINFFIKNLYSNAWMSIFPFLHIHSLPSCKFVILQDDVSISRMHLNIFLFISLITHCLIFDKKLSNAMDMPENFYKNGIILAEIDKNLGCLGHISIEQIFYKIFIPTEKITRWRYWS